MFNFQIIGAILIFILVIAFAFAMTYNGNDVSKADKKGTK